MSKSQNTKNEQQKDLCITSEQLTEQWRKGELPSYEEWQALKASYEILNDANLKQATWMADMEKENAKLKDLLEECREEITGNFESFINIIADGETADLIRRIDEVLNAE